MPHCASRFEGDADLDGDVDDDDYDIWASQYGSGSLMSGMMMVAMAPNVAAGMQAAMEPLERAAELLGSLAAGQSIPNDPDMNADGVLDEADLVLLDAAILGSP